MWRHGGDWWRLWTESRVVDAAALAETPLGPPSEYTPGADSGAGVATREAATSVPAWQPLSVAPPAAPADAPLGPPSGDPPSVG